MKEEDMMDWFVERNQPPAGRVVPLRPELMPIADTAVRKIHRSQMAIGTLLYSVFILAPWALLFGLIYGFVRIVLRLRSMYP